MTIESMPSPFASARTLIVKLGSAVLTRGGGELDLETMRGICGEVAALTLEGRKVVIVTSGAVAAGRAELKVFGKRPTISEKQALAAVGQSRLMQIYSDLFSAHKIVVGQMLLTRGDMEDRRRYVNARYTLEELLNRGCVPIINENDTVTVDELRFGDNDGLAALVAVKMQADALILLSDVDGLFDRDPRTHKNAQLLEDVKTITAEMEETLAGADGSTAAVGSGGMASKIAAARVATAAGVWVAIAHGKLAGQIRKVLSGDFRGTLFHPSECKHSLRRKWLLSGKSGGRTIAVDDGALKALVDGKKSLLPAGVKSVSGAFSFGDIVEIVDKSGRALGRGIVNYSSVELERIRGRKTAEIESILGAKPYDEAVHRDNLALFESPR